MNILGIEKLSLVDYPNNVCAVLFTGGCNFKCPFCHNSGIVESEFKPLNNIEILDFLECRKKFLDGVCVSGGEPTLQPDLVDFIRKIKNMGYKVKLDTNGTNPNVLENLISLKLIDYVAMDIKNSLDKYSLAHKPTALRASQASALVIFFPEANLIKSYTVIPLNLTGC